MGQQLFIPKTGNDGDGRNAVFLTGLYADGAYVDYGLSSGADVFYTNQILFTACIAFRMIRENTSAENIPLLTVLDAVSNGWRFFINTDNRICAQVNNNILVSGSDNIPLGRVCVATLSSEVGGGELYLNGLPMDSSIFQDIPPVYPVSLTLGGGGSWSKNFVEFIGWGYLKRFLPFGDNADLYMKIQDTGRVAFPSNVVFGEPYAVYNASDGLSNLALFTPEQPNTLGAPNLPAIPNGLATGTLLNAPFHVAYSGWADIASP